MQDYWKFTDKLGLRKIADRFGTEEQLATLNINWDIIDNVLGKVAEMLGDNAGTDVRDYKTLVPSYNTLSDIYTGDWSLAIQQAFTDASTKRNKDVFVPEADFRITKQLSVPKGVSIVSTRGKLIRNYRRENGGGPFIKLLGNNIIKGLSVDGGSQTIVPLDVEDGRLYTDCDCDWAEGDVTFENCTFSNTNGSNIIFSQYNLKVKNCKFGNYGDHNIYIGGRSWNDARMPDSVVIEGCTFYQRGVVTGTLDAVKVRNGCKLLILEGNTFDIEANVFGFWSNGSWDSLSYPAKVNNKIIISNNTILSCLDFISSGGDMAGTDDIVIAGNTVTATRTLFRLGYSDYSTAFKKMLVANNTLRTYSLNGSVSKLALINGALAGMGEIGSIIFSDNEMEYEFNSGLEVYGNIRHLKISGGRIKNTAPYNAGNRLVDIAPNSNNYVPTIKGHVIIENVTLDGEIASLIRERNDTKPVTEFKFDATVKGNIWTSQNAKKVFDVQGDKTSTISTIARDIHNLFVGGTRGASSFNTLNLVQIDYVQANKGTVTYSGDGTATSKAIPHGLNGTPTFFMATPANSATGTAGIRNITADATNITVYFNTAPASGSNNLKLVWKAEL